MDESVFWNKVFGKLALDEVEQFCKLEVITKKKKTSNESEREVKDVMQLT